MPQQEYIKFLYEKEGCSINEISSIVGINWRTAAKYANKEDWNCTKIKQRRSMPVMEPFRETVDVWILEDLLLPRKERRTARAIWKLLKREHGFAGSERTVRAYVSEQKKRFKSEQEEKYLELVHPAGEAQCDFGVSHVIWDGEFKEIRSLITAYPFSNGGFCIPLPGENALCFLFGLRLTFEMSGGVPRKIRFDNLPAAVTSIGKDGKRGLNEMFSRFMLHYRFEAEFCNQGKGNEKGGTENKVGYTRRNWLIPYPKATSFEALTEELYNEALEDLQRPHYAKGVSMSELWAEEQKALLPLPKEPFEPVELKTKKVNKYGKVKIESETYDLPCAWIGQSILAKIWWDRVELLDQDQVSLGIFPRPYTMKSTPIDWKGHFAIFVRKPKGARNSTLYSFLPPAVHSYLETGELVTYRDRLKRIHAMLEQGYVMEHIAKALEKANHAQLQDPALLWHLLYQLSQEKPLDLLEEDHSPPSLKNYQPQAQDYDQLVPQSKGGETRAAAPETTV